MQEWIQLKQDLRFLKSTLICYTTDFKEIRIMSTKSPEHGSLLKWGPHWAKSHPEATLLILTCSPLWTCVGLTKSSKMRALWQNPSQIMYCVHQNEFYLPCAWGNTAKVQSFWPPTIEGKQSLSFSNTLQSKQAVGHVTVTSLREPRWYVSMAQYWALSRIGQFELCQMALFY